jgi:hypothetical protein
MVKEMETSAAHWNNNSIIYLYFAWGLYDSRYSWLQLDDKVQFTFRGKAMRL